MAGHVSDVEAEAELQYSTAVAEHIDYPRVSWCLLRGVVGVMRGLPRTAARALTEGIAVIGSDDRGWLRPMHAYMSMACALEGDIAAAEEHERRAATANRSTDGIFAIDVRRARAWTRAARGEMTAALEEARAAADQAARTGQAALESFALHDVARFGRAVEVVERLAELSARVDGLLIEPFAAHARALADGDGRALDQVASEFASLELDLFAAEASAAAARAYREEGRRASAYAALDRSRGFARRCESARTPALALADEPADLTGREREVAELAAAGMASRDIADRLGIATRTVDNLLGRVYVKLGLTGRRELVELLGQRRSR
jgi:DNA-binding CsgD family transcriptional regulator